MTASLTPAERAVFTAQRSMSDAAGYVEDAFPEYPPELQATLISALVTAAASHEIATHLRLLAEETVEASHILSRGISDLQAALRSDHPLMGQTLDGLAEGLQQIARSIGRRQPSEY